MKPPKFFVDENLSPKIAILLREDGIDAIHGRDRGLLQASDADVFEYALGEDRIVVTLNVVDFVKLALGCDVHPGLILLEEGGSLAEQIQLVRRAIALIDAEFVAGRDMVNRALRLATDGHEFETLP